MFDNRMDLFEETSSPNERYSASSYKYNMALNQFKSSLFKGKLLRLRRKVLHRKFDLYDLSALKPDLRLRGSFYTGIKVVPVCSIIGSESRSADFDMAFHPLNEGGRERWISMAIAYLSFLPLPPVQLIEVGDAYFVRDGHHRISVSRAFGQTAMDAEVITWQACPPFPWQMDVTMPGETLLPQHP